MYYIDLHAPERLSWNEGHLAESRDALVWRTRIIGCPGSTNLPIPEILDPFLKLFGRLSVDLPRELGLVIILQHAGIVFHGVRRCCWFSGMIIVVVVATIDAVGACGFCHPEVVMHINGLGRRRGGNARYEEGGPCSDRTFGRGQ